MRTPKQAGPRAPRGPGVRPTTDDLLLAGAGAAERRVFQEGGRETEPVIPVQVAKAARASIGHFINASGVLYPRDQAGVTPKISAPVKKFLVNRGDRVSAGQLLAVLENRDLEAAVLDGKGQMEQTQSNLRSVNTASLPEETAKSQHDVEATREALDAARKLLESRQQLFHDGAIARRLVDEAAVALAQAKSQYETASQHLQTVQGAGRQEQVKSAEAQVESARGRFENAQAQLAYSEIRSPIAGMIADRPLYAGEMASAGTPLLTVNGRFAGDCAGERSRNGRGGAAPRQSRYHPHSQWRGAGQGDCGEPGGGPAKHHHRGLGGGGESERSAKARGGGAGEHSRGNHRQRAGGSGRGAAAGAGRQQRGSGGGRRCGGARTQGAGWRERCRARCRC